MRCIYVGNTVLLRLATIVLIAIISLQVLRVLFFIEYLTPYLLAYLGIAELSRCYGLVEGSEVRESESTRCTLELLGVYL